MRKLVTDEQKKLIIDAYVDMGLSPMQIKQVYKLDMCDAVIRKILRESGVYKTNSIDREALFNKVSKEELEQYYDGHSKEDTAKHFQISINEFNILRDHYGVKKSAASIYKIRVDTVKSKYGVENVFQRENFIKENVEAIKERFNKNLEDFLSGVPQSEVIDYYKVNSFYDTCSHFGITREMLIRITKMAGFVKDFSCVWETKRLTCMEKYGTPFAQQSVIIKDKIKNTCLDKYGVESPFQSDEIKEKIKATNLQKYGVENVFQSDEIKEKIFNTNLEKYGCRVTSQRKCLEYEGEFKNIFDSYEKSVEYLSRSRKTYRELAEEFSCPLYTVVFWVNKFNLNSYIKHEKSHYEDEIADYIGRDLCVMNSRKILDNLEVDIYVPSHKLAIEFNGNYWHSTLHIHDKNYHLNKSIAAEKIGVRLIHIYQYEWEDTELQNKIKMLIDISMGRVNNKIFARNCEVKVISNVEAKPFNESTHLQGHRNAQVTYGLFHNGELVQLMSFSKTKYNRNLNGVNDWEIIRGCPGSNNIVIGGVSKLFTHFVRDYDPDRVFSYCDFNKFSGGSYSSLGMKFIGYTGPDKTWLLKDNTCQKRNPKKYRELSQNSKGIIWGSGSKKYLWEKQG